MTSHPETHVSGMTDGNITTASVFISGLPKKVTIDKIMNFFGSDIGIRKKKGQYQVFILHTDGAQTHAHARITFTKSKRAKHFMESYDGKRFNNFTMPLRVQWFQFGKTPSEGEPCGQKAAKTNTAAVPAIAKKAFTSVLISNIPDHVPLPTLFNNFNNKWPGISKWDNWVPKIKILSVHDDDTVSAEVTFDTEQQASDCICKTKGRHFNENGFPQTRLSIKPQYEDNANPKRYAAHSSKELSDQKDCTVWINGFPPNWNEVSINSFICGIPYQRPITRMLKRVPEQSYRSALVTFSEPKEAYRFIWEWDLRNLPNTKLQIAAMFHEGDDNNAAEFNESETPQENIVEQQTPLNKRIIWNVVFVQGLPKTATRSVVINAFKQFGEVRKINLLRGNDKEPNGCGTVSFATMAAAERCINTLDKIQLTDGHVLRAKYYEKMTKKPKNDVAEVASTEPSGSNVLKPKTRKIRNRRFKKRTKAFDCITCFETCEEVEMIGCVPIDNQDFDQDTHHICLECARRHAEALMTDGEVGNGGTGLPCCMDGCARVILRANVLKLVDGNTAKLLDKRMTSVALLGIDGIEYCKRCDYGEIIEANTIQIQYFNCKNDRCRTIFCRECKVDYNKHVGKNCDQADPSRAIDKRRKQYEEDLSAAVIRICPKCNTQFQKLDGCNKMKCQTCHTTMCYLCRSTNITYDHFRNGGICNQDADSTAYDEARLREVRAKYQTDFARNQQPAQVVNRAPVVNPRPVQAARVNYERQDADQYYRPYNYGYEQPVYRQPAAEENNGWGCTIS